MGTFKQLTNKFDWVNPHIEKNFPLIEVPKDTEYKLFHFDKISSDEAIKEIEKEGYRVANLSELLAWPEWNEKDTVIALGSVGGVGGDRCVPCLRQGDSGRRLNLGWWGSDWGADYRFLAVRNSSLEKSDTEKSALESLDLLPLELELSALVRIEGKVDKLLNHLGIGK